MRLYYRSIESGKSCCPSEHNGNYDQHISLSSDAIADLNWVIHNLSQYNGSYFSPKPISLMVESDASLLGWGATWDGQPAQDDSGHHWKFHTILISIYNY